MGRFFIFAGIILLAACSPVPSVPPRVTIKSDAFSPDVVIDGFAEIAFEARSQKEHVWLIRSAVNKHTLTTLHQIYFHVQYTGPRKNFSHASDEFATELKVTTIRKTDCMSATCDKTESVGIAVDENMLRTHVSDGYRVKITARSGDSYILPLTPLMIRLQLEAVDRTRQELKAGEAVPNPE